RFEALCEELREAAPQTAEESPTVAVQPSPNTTASPAPSPLQVAPRQRLPLYLTRFFGRERERQQLADLLVTDRLITLTGSGGMGKTRLAVETARESAFSCVFVPLADLPDPSRVPEATLRALGITPKADVDLVEHLVSVLQPRGEFLLILDNA